MKSRREVIQAGAVLGAVSAVAQAQQPHGAHAPDLLQIKLPRKARFFTPVEMALLAAVAERIIPKSDTPGAAEAGVAYFIDLTAHLHAATGEAIRTDLAWIASQDFAAKSPTAQDELLTAWMRSTGEPRRIFTRFKDLTIDGYYGTREGLQVELGWNANTFLREYKGCTHPEHG